MPSDKSIAAGLAVIGNDKSKILGLRVGKHNVEPGLLIPKAEAQEVPELSFAGADFTATYMVVCLDVDAPFTSFSFMSPILHWIQPGLKVRGDVFEATEPFIVDYAGPGPPPRSGPHRYCFFLYEQPERFHVKAHAPSGGAKVGIWPRVRYSLDDWEKKADLGEVIAANYFTSN